MNKHEWRARHERMKAQEFIEATTSISLNLGDSELRLLEELMRRTGIRNRNLLLRRALRAYAQAELTNGH